MIGVADKILKHLSCLNIQYFELIRARSNTTEIIQDL